jgi:glutaredoxin
MPPSDFAQFFMGESAVDGTLFLQRMRFFPERGQLHDQSSLRGSNHQENIRENPEYEQELIALCGAKTVPVLVIDGKPLRGCEEINQFLVGKFL